jgi:acetyl esterase/lipase
MKMLIVFILLSLGMRAALAEPWLFKPKDVSQLHHQPATAKLNYGTAPQTFGLLRLPSGPGPYPVAMIIHGGCWITPLADVTSTEAFADALRDRGFATWNIEYRAADASGGGFPGTFLDVANAADYLRQIAPRYHLNLQRVIAIGHSAGGHLALWLGARSKLPKNSALYLDNPLPLQGVISLGGVPSLEGARIPAEKICGGDVIGQLLGQKKHEIAKTVYEETSPIDMVPLYVPQILIAGEMDNVVPVAMSQAYAQKANALGDSVKIIRVPYSGHHEYIVPNSVVWPFLVDELKRFQ